MKRFGIYSVLLVFLLALSMSFMSCAGSTPTKFEGTWEHPNPLSGPAIFIFDGNNFTYTWAQGSRSGTFTYDGGYITLRSAPFTWITPYRFGVYRGMEYVGFEQGTGMWPGWFGIFLRH